MSVEDDLRLAVTFLQQKEWSKGLYVCPGCRFSDGHHEDCERGIALAALAHVRDETRETIKGLMEIAAMAMPDTYFASDSRVNRARQLLDSLAAARSGRNEGA